MKDQLQNNRLSRYTEKRRFRAYECHRLWDRAISSVVFTQIESLTMPTRNSPLAKVFVLLWGGGSLEVVAIGISNPRPSWTAECENHVTWSKRVGVLHRLCRLSARKNTRPV